MSNSHAQSSLQALVNQAVEQTRAEFAALPLAADELAVTVVDLKAPGQPVAASYRGDEPIYPASVSKLFFLYAAHAWLERGQLADTPELQRALHDMIVYSYNEATSYVVDLLTGTTSGPELPPEELARWQDQRNAVNRYFFELGYTGINLNRKTWGEGPYGRETQAMAAFEPRRNFLTTDVTARLLVAIANRQAVTPARSEAMLGLLQRDFSQPGDPDHQAHEFTAPGLPPDAKLWSKAGYMSTQRHDAALVELADGHRFVLVTFTAKHVKEKRIIHTVSRLVTTGMAARV